MLIGYLSCLLMPGYYLSEQKAGVIAQQIELTQSVSELPSVQATTCNYCYQQMDATIEEEKIQICSAVNSFVYFVDLQIDLQNSFSFTLFSRPPPTLV
jgi:hypothetical protein